MKSKIKFIYNNFYDILKRLLVLYLTLLFILQTAQAIDNCYLNSVMDHLTSLIVALLLYLSGRFK